MNKKSIFTFAISMLLGIVAGAFIVWTVTTINKKNSEIASLKEQISMEQTERTRDILRFALWQLKVEQLAKDNDSARDVRYYRYSRCRI